MPGLRYESYPTYGFVAEEYRLAGWSVWPRGATTRAPIGLVTQIGTAEFAAFMAGRQIGTYSSRQRAAIAIMRHHRRANP